MSQPITETNRVARLMGTLQSNVDLTEVPDSTVEWVLQHPREAGQQFTAFLHNGARLVFGALITIVNRMHKFNPVKFISENWTIWCGRADGNGKEGEEAQDVRSLALSEIDWSKIIFETSLLEGETSITGEEKLRRLIESGVIRLDAAVGESLWSDYQSNKENSVLERLRRERGITYLDFFGTILRGPSGSRRVLCLGWRVGGWHWGVRWLGDDWYADHVSPVLV